LAVLSREAQRGSRIPNEPHWIGPIGPDGLNGVQWLDGRTERLLAVRGRTREDLVAIARSAVSGVPAGTRLVAEQRASWVPGIGSLPMSAWARGYALSYTSSPGASDQQRSLAVGTLRARASDAEVLRWWFGNGQLRAGRWTFTSPAYDGEGAPSARLTLEIGDEGIGVLVRTAALGVRRHNAFVDEVVRMRHDQWQRWLVRFGTGPERASGPST
jgi:hypothetical protein